MFLKEYEDDTDTGTKYYKHLNYVPRLINLNVNTKIS